MPKATTQRKKGKKEGGNKKKPANKRYLLEHRWVKNKAKRVAKKMRKFPGYNPGNLSLDIRVLIRTMV